MFVASPSKVKNSEHRAKVKKASSEGLVLNGDSAPQLFSPEFVNEALIISDLFQLNELSAVQLLIEGRVCISIFIRMRGCFDYDYTGCSSVPKLGMTSSPN